MSGSYAETVITGDDPGQTIADRQPILLAGLGAACISASAVLVKLAGTGTATTAFFRCLLALPVLITLAVLEQRRRGTRPLATRLGAVLAGLFLAIDLVLWNHAIAEVGAGIATVLGNLQVLFVAFAAWAAFGERPGRRFLMALPVVMAGVVLVSGMLGGSSRGIHPVAGIGYGIGTSVAYAGFLLILRQTSAGTPHVAGPLAEATAGAALGALLLGLVFGGLRLEMPWPSFGWLLLLSLTSQTIGWLLITSSLPRLPAALSSLLLLLQPAASLLLAAVVLGEQPTLFQLAGALLVCGGVLAVSRAAPARRDLPDSHSDSERNAAASPVIQPAPAHHPAHHAPVPDVPVPDVPVPDVPVPDVPVPAAPDFTLRNPLHATLEP
jgi:drug/metabolite transporter (DMT)-like permease